MKRTILALSSALLIAGGAFAQTATPTASQSAALTTADVQKLGNGWRASEIHGSSVYNEQNDKVGSVDDLIINRSDNVVYAVLSVGGFLGVGTRLIAVPYNQLRLNTDSNGKVDRIMLPGATVEGLKALPEFNYGAS